MTEFRLHMRKITHLRGKCAGILLYNADRWENPNFFWLSNAAMRGWMWIPFKGRPTIFTSKTYNEPGHAWAKTEFISTLDDLFGSLPEKRLGIDVVHMPAALFNKIRSHKRITDVSASLEAARSVKTPYEIKTIRKACQITADILRSLELPRGITEARLRADIEWDVACQGLEPAFPTIVASGSHIATPHHIPVKQPIRKTLLIDMGVRYKGYCSDVTRTFGSKYKPLIRKVIFDTIEPMLKPGTKVADIDAAARKALGPLEKRFITGLGHGVGVAIHEMPGITSKSKDVLEAGNVITIEPGIYVPNGIRHENVYVITKNGAENLTDF